MSDDVPELTHAEIEELLGAYALDAVDRETAARVEAHLDHCVRCSIEVAQHHEVAGLLANSGGASPVGLWDGIASRLDGTSPPSWEGLADQLVVGNDRTDRLPATDGSEHDGSDRYPEAATVVPLESKRPGRGRLAAACLVAAAAVVVAIALGVQVHHLDNRVSALQGRSTLTGAEAAALADPSTEKVTLEPGPGAASSGVTGRVTVVLTSTGTGFVEGDGLAGLPTDRTYQLWGVIGGQAISLGLLGRDPGVVPFSVAGGSPVDAFVITDEHAGGVVHSVNRPVVVGEVQA